MKLQKGMEGIIDGRLLSTNSEVKSEISKLSQRMATIEQLLNQNIDHLMARGEGADGSFSNFSAARAPSVLSSAR